MLSLDQFKDWAIKEGSVAKFTDGQFLGECVSLINQYLGRVFGISAGAWGHAYAWANDDNNSVREYFDKVGSPEKGDIGVMGQNYGDGKGHIFIYLSPNTILEQNGRVPRKVSIGSAYSNPIAILRRKGGNDMKKWDHGDSVNFVNTFTGGNIPQFITDQEGKEFHDAYYAIISNPTIIYNSVKLNGGDAKNITDLWGGDETVRLMLANSLWKEAFYGFMGPNYPSKQLQLQKDQIAELEKQIKNLQAGKPVETNYTQVGTIHNEAVYEKK